jgi:two-component system, CitB family, response regulator
VQPTRVQVIHIEDDLMERMIVRRFLSQIQEFNFFLDAVGSEDAALESLRVLEPDLVILDYYLRQGRGASCLRGLRRLDPDVPILCLSGSLNSYRTAELLALGASECLDKLDLDRRGFSRSVRAALSRRLVPSRVAMGERDRVMI